MLVRRENCGAGGPDGRPRASGTESAGSDACLSRVLCVYLQSTDGRVWRVEAGAEPTTQERSDGGEVGVGELAVQPQGEIVNGNPSVPSLRRACLYVPCPTPERWTARGQRPALGMCVCVSVCVCAQTYVGMSMYGGWLICPHPISGTPEF